MTNLTLPKRLALALLPGLAATGMGLLEEWQSFGDVGEALIAIFWYLAVGAFVLAPLNAAHTRRVLRTAGLFVAPFPMAFVAGGLFSLLPELPGYGSAGMVGASYTAAAIGVAMWLGARRPARHFMRYAAALLVLAGATGWAAMSGFSECFLGGCTNVDRAMMYGGISVAIFLLPVLFVLLMHATSEARGEASA